MNKITISDYFKQGTKVHPEGLQPDIYILTAYQLKQLQKLYINSSSVMQIPSHSLKVTITQA